jgi:hypothetical protein
MKGGCMNDPAPNHHGRRGICIVFALFLGYFVSIGPMQSLHNRGYVAGGDWRNDRIYSPAAWIFDHSPGPIQDAIFWYVRLFDPNFCLYRTNGGVI